MTRQLLTALAALLTLPALSACDDEEVDTGACDVHDDCDDTEVCFNNRCQAAYGQRYLVTIVGASYIPPTTPEDAPWDPTGGDPDPYLVLTDQDGNACTTQPIEDTIAPTWNHPCGDTFEVLEETRFSWVIYEDDEGDEDPIMRQSAEGEELQITVDSIRAATFSHTSNGVMVNFRIDRR